MAKKIKFCRKQNFILDSFSFSKTLLKYALENFSSFDETEDKNPASFG